MSGKGTRYTYCCNCLYVVLDRTGRQPPVFITWTPSDGGPSRREELGRSMRALEQALERESVTFEIGGYGIVSILAETLVGGNSLCIEHAIDTMTQRHPYWWPGYQSVRTR